MSSEERRDDRRRSSSSSRHDKMAIGRHVVAARPTVSITPRTDAQRRYVDMLRAPAPHVVVGHGDAGCGKTYIAAQVGAQHLFEKRVERLIITRPALCAGEELGFLPGTLLDKVMPYIRPVYDVLRAHLSEKEISALIANRTIEVVPVAFMRGRSFDDAFIIVDEGQNCTPRQLFMILTRIGKNSKIVISGDPRQSDLEVGRVDGLSDLLSRIHKEDGWQSHFGVVDFGPGDCQRHAVVPTIMRMYGMHE